MPTMNINLTPELAKLVQKKVESGLYNSASEVVRESLRLMHRREERAERELEAYLQSEEFKQKLVIGIAQADAGEGKTYKSAEEWAQEFDKEACALLAERKAARA